MDTAETVAVEIPLENIPEAVAPENQSQTNENDVAIAAIEADARVATEEIRASENIAIAEANAEARIEEAQIRIGEEIWTAERINQLSVETAEMREKIASLEAQLAPPSLAEVEAITEALETVAEQNLTDQSMSDPTNSMETEHSESAEEEKPVAEILVAKKPIFRLV